MWTQEELDTINISLAQKLVPFPTNSQQIEDTLGNLTLCPEAIPVTETERLILSAITMAFYISQKSEITIQEVDIPSKIEYYSSTSLEAILLLSISSILPSICVITTKSADKIFYINPQLLLSKSLILDTGLTTKQLIKPKMNDFVIIPIKRASRLQYVDIKESKTLKSIEIPDRVSSIVISTISSNFVDQPLHTTKQKMKTWFQNTKGYYKI